MFSGFLGGFRERKRRGFRVLNSADPLLLLLSLLLLFLVILLVLVHCLSYFYSSLVLYVSLSFGLTPGVW